MTDFEPVDVSRDSLLDTRTAAKENQGKVRSSAFSHRPFFVERPPRAALLRALEAPLAHPRPWPFPNPTLGITPLCNPPRPPRSQKEPVSATPPARRGMPSMLS